VSAGCADGPNGRRLSHQPLQGLVHLDAERFGVLGKKRPHVVGGRPAGGIGFLRFPVSRGVCCPSPRAAARRTGGRRVIRSLFLFFMMPLY
jgi:hypothetical protein